MLADDLKALIRETGVPFTIIKTTGNISGEYLEYETNEQATKPFTKEHNLNVEFYADTQVTVGNIIEAFGSVRWLVMHLSDEKAFNESTTQSGVIYRTNCKADIKKKSVSGKQYDPTITWPIQHADIDCVLVDKDYGAKEADILVIPKQDIERNLLLAYLSKDIPLEVGDRFTIKGVTSQHGPSGEFNMEVSNIALFEFRGVQVVYLKEDPRK